MIDLNFVELLGSPLYAIRVKRQEGFQQVRVGSLRAPGFPARSGRQLAQYHLEASEPLPLRIASVSTDRF